MDDLAWMQRMAPDSESARAFEQRRTRMTWTATAAILAACSLIVLMVGLRSPLARNDNLLPIVQAENSWAG